MKIALIVLAIVVYFLFPIDLIPDFIVGPGQLDDLAVAGFGIKKIMETLKQKAAA